MRDPDHAARFVEEFSDRILYGSDICVSFQNYHITFDKFLDKMVEDKMTHRAQMLEALFTQLLVTLSRVCHPLDTEALPKSGSASTELVLQAVREQMLSQLSHPWQITELAAMARLSPSRFYAVYKARFGLPPMEELISARIETARRRLTDTRISVRDLAENLGYQNVTHFCRQFRQRTGMTPSQYRAALNLDEA